MVTKIDRCFDGNIKTIKTIGGNIISVYNKVKLLKNC